MLDRIRHYLVMVAFTIGLALGLQVPAFIDQYTQRVDAHYREVVENFRGYQQIADIFHGGDIQALIEKHEHSTDAVFRAEARPMRATYQRLNHFAQEQAALARSFVHRAIHVMVFGDEVIVKETFRGYAASLPLDMNALISGLSGELLYSALFELGLLVISRVLRRARGNRQSPA